ncbi:MAG: HAD-IA family hydrolase [Rhodobacteraceae bacterium]|nr:HAD-IA family hydrolase [Paracoccaceae bacterium]
MTDPLRLVIFDVDGTLVDSQHEIIACMSAAFSEQSLPAPDRKDVLSIVGLSLDQAMEVLAPGSTGEVRARLADGYRTQFRTRRESGSASQTHLYPGCLEALKSAFDVPHWLLGIATGKSRRGLNALLAAHELQSHFVTTQVADDHPSKPHPSMILTAMAEAGVEPEATVMVGDTVFDMEMAVSAGVPFIGVDWGYHPEESLTSSLEVLSDFGQLVPALNRLWSDPA